MKIKNFKSLIEEKYDGPEDDKKSTDPKKLNALPKHEEEEEDEEDYVPDTGNAKDDTVWPDEEEEDDDVEEEDPNFEGKEDMEHLLYLIREVLKGSGIEDIFVSNKEYDISIMVAFNKKEKLGDIIKVFETIRKVRKDLLNQYSTDFEICEAKDGSPLMIFNFDIDDSHVASVGNTGNVAKTPVTKKEQKDTQQKLWPNEDPTVNKNKRGSRGGKGSGRGADNNYPTYDPDDNYPFL